MGTSSTPGNTVKFDYDDSFNPKSATQPTGAQSTAAWTQKSGGRYPETLTSASGDKVTNGYDTSGNMMSQTDTTTGSDGAKWTYDYNNAGSTLTYDYNDANQLMRTGNGRPTPSSPALTASGTASAYTYAGVDNNNRLTRGSSTFTNAATGMTREDTTGFVRKASGTLTAMTSGGASQYYLTDVQGSVIGLVDASGKRTATYSYGPYGEARTTSGTNQPYRYTGTYLDVRPVQDGRPLLRPPTRPLHPARPLRQGKQPVRLRRRRPINKMDPNGLSFFDAVGKGFDIYDVGSMAKDISEGNYKDALATGVGMAAGAAAEAGCGAVATAVSAPTAGVGGLAVGATCFGIGYGAGELGEKAASSVLN